MPTSARPHGVVDLQRTAERGAARTREQAPRDHHVAGRIADAEATEVDDRARRGRPRQARCPEADPRGTTRALDPTPGPPAQRPTRPWPPRCRSHHRARRSRLASLRPAPPGSAPRIALQRRCVTRVDPLQRGDERGDVACGRARIGEILDRRDLTREPAVDGPVVGIALGGRPLRKRDGERQREVGREAGQPDALLLGLSDRPTDARKSHAEFVAQAVDRVIGARRFDRFDREFGPLRELRAEQPAHEIDVRVDLVEHAFSEQTQDPRREASRAEGTPMPSPEAPLVHSIYGFARERDISWAIWRFARVRLASTNTSTNSRNAIRDVAREAGADAVGIGDGPGREWQHEARELDGGDDCVDGAELPRPKVQDARHQCDEEATHRETECERDAATPSGAGAIAQPAALALSSAAYRGRARPFGR